MVLMLHYSLVAMNMSRSLVGGLDPTHSDTCEWDLGTII